jgi:acetylornithine deacetylase/succinyl-diaminopimelate desuccinylase-like protein
MPFFAAIAAATPLLSLLAADAPAAPAPPGPADRALVREVFKQLVETDTSQSNGDTTVAAQAVAKRLRAAGLPAADVQVLGPSPRRGNLVARLRGTGRARPLLLLAHLDVVDAHRTDWTVDPFVLTERDGYFYGRGTQDDKSLAAIWVDTLIRLRREGARLDRDLILALTADEENGPENGVAWLLAHHRPLVDAELCLTEGAGGELKDGRRLSIDVQPSEKSYLSFTLEVKNKGGHSSLPEPDNAIVRLAEAVARVHHHAFPVEVGPVARAYFQRMAAIERGPLGDDMRAVAATTPDPAAAARLSRLPYYNARLRTTCVPTEISGGHAENALPQTARATVNCRVLPGHGSDEIHKTLVDVVDDPAVQVAVKGAFDPSPPSPLPPALLGTIERTGAAVWPGVPVVPILLTGATDGRHLRAAGIPTYGLTGVFVDIGDIRAHGKDERIPVASLYEAQDFLYRVVVDLGSGGAGAAGGP